MLRLKSAITAVALYASSAAVFLALAQEEGMVFRSESRLVVLHTTVTDENGNLVTDLPARSFHVFENDVPQEIKVFRREDAPVSMGLIIDDSASMYPKRERVKSAALALVRASNPADEVFVLNFNDRPYLDTDFTSNIGALEEALGRIDSRGTTAMRDAVRLSIEHLRGKAREEKKVLLVVTDGEDNASTVAADYLVRAAQQNGVLVYAVGLLSDNNPDEARRAQRDLDALTRATGGRAYYLNNISEIGRAAQEIARDIRNQYTLAYSPSNEALDGTYRAIRVTVDSARPVSVRTRSGYYAVPGAPVQRAGSESGSSQ